MSLVTIHLNVYSFKNIVSILIYKHVPGTILVSREYSYEQLSDTELKRHDLKKILKNNN